MMLVFSSPFFYYSYPFPSLWNIFNCHQDSVYVCAHSCVGVQKKLKEHASWPVNRRCLSVKMNSKHNRDERFFNKLEKEEKKRTVQIRSRTHPFSASHPARVNESHTSRLLAVNQTLEHSVLCGVIRWVICISTKLLYTDAWYTVQLASFFVCIQTHTYTHTRTHTHVHTHTHSCFYFQVIVVPYTSIASISYFLVLLSCQKNMYIYIQNEIFLLPLYSFTSGLIRNKSFQGRRFYPGEIIWIKGGHDGETVE